MKFDRLAFVDVETTGGSAFADRIIEIGVLRVENGKLTETYSTLVDPECSISPWITTITGIKDSDVKGAPTFHQIAEKLKEILSGCIFVAHNVRFDYGFIKSEFDRHGIEFNSPHFCTVKLSRALFPRAKRHNLDSLIKRHKISCLNRHRAFDDAQVLWEFYQKVRKKFSEDKIAAALELVSKRVSWPVNIPKEEIERLPDTSGVYIFYGDNELPLYVGKSINIKARVTSHFNDDLKTVREMKLAQQLRRIEVLPTAGELGALIKESEMIKKLQPLYNRLLRKSERLSMVCAEPDPEGYLSAYLADVDQQQVEPGNMQKIYGVFRTKRHAERELKKMAEEHTLCPKLLGLEKTKRTCFAYQLKKCRGACLREESPELYNLRFEIAFSKLKFKKWPYEQPVVIEESNGDRHDAYLVDKWCFLGSVDPVSGQRELFEEAGFDLDIYKILKAFFLNPKNRHKIRQFDFNPEQIV